MPSSLDERHPRLLVGRTLSHLDLRHAPLPHGPTRPDRLESRHDGALLHVPADSSYMASARDDLVLRDVRVSVRGRCLDASSALGVVARMRVNGAGRSGYSLLAQPGTSSFVLIDFRVSAHESHFRVLRGWQVTDALRGPGESNLVELRCMGHTLQVFINDVLVASVIDGHYEKGSAGWAVRSYVHGSDVLLSSIDVGEVLASPHDDASWSAPPVALRAPGPSAAANAIASAASAVASAPWTPSPHAVRRPRMHFVSPPPLAPAFEHLPPPVDDPLMNASPRAAVDASVVAMAREGDFWARHAAARHPACPPALLARLGSDMEWVVRLVVASRSDCPAVVLDRLGSDEKELVRHAVALNPLCSVELLERLTLDRSPDIDLSVARHPRCPPGLRARLERRWAGRSPRSARSLGKRAHDVPWNATPPSSP